MSGTYLLTPTKLVEVPYLQNNSLRFSAGACKSGGCCDAMVQWPDFEHADSVRWHSDGDPRVPSRLDSLVQRDGPVWFDLAGHVSIMAVLDYDGHCHEAHHYDSVCGRAGLQCRSDLRKCTCGRIRQNRQLRRIA